MGWTALQHGSEPASSFQLPASSYEGRNSGLHCSSEFERQTAHSELAEDEPLLIQQGKHDVLQQQKEPNKDFRLSSACSSSGVGGRGRSMNSLRRSDGPSEQRFELIAVLLISSSKHFVLHSSFP